MMLIQDKKQLAVRVKNQTVRFDSFAFIEREQAEKKAGVLYGVGKNCAIKGGALCPGVGFTAIQDDEDAVHLVDVT